MTAIAASKEDEVKLEGDRRGYEDGRLLAESFNDEKKYYDYSNSKVPKPNRETILGENYDFLKDKYSYNEVFYRAYIAGHKRGYTDYIRRQGANIPGSPSPSGSDIATNLGGVFGLIYGEIEGLKDYGEGKSSNWSRAIPKDGAINSSFDLGNFPASYRTKFLLEFKEEFQKGYEEAYFKAQFHITRDSLDSGRGDGELFGSTLGNAFGAKDFYEGKSSDYKRNIPSDSKIAEDYLLDKESRDYLKGFINGFKMAYEEAYIKSFSDARNLSLAVDEFQGYENGFSLGNIRGSAQANIDYLEGLASDYTRSRPLSSVIIRDYNLTYQSKNYRDGFIGGFYNGYAAGYGESYIDLSQGAAENQGSFFNVPISGGTFTSYDRLMSLTLDRGIFFNDIALNIAVLNTNYAIDKRYIKATDFYRIGLVNPSNEYLRDKKIQVSFDYYGDQSGGIYLLKDNKWQYLKSNLENGRISADISPELLKGSGSVFVVFFDKNYSPLYDIRGHWAKEEIEIFNRRNIIFGYGDKTFRPEQNITRAEFLVLLSRVYNWSLPTDISNLSNFKDRKNIAKDYERAISYGLSAGYIQGYGDGSYRPNNPISYREVDLIMRRVLKDSSFSWKSFAEGLKYDKKVASQSLDSMDNKINRAEFSYLLYELTKWDY